jgi:ABC-type sugar transport system substrate-binding protein
MRDTSTLASDEVNTFTVVLIPKIGNLFSEEIYGGCLMEAWVGLTPESTINVNCVHLPPKHADAQEQANLILDVVTNPYNYGILTDTIDFMAVSVLDENVTGMAINYVRSKNVSVVTLDSDAPESNRVAFIGPNNTDFGVKLGEAMNKAQPEGGNYRILTGLVRVR